MAYPPALPPATRTDSTAAAGTHAADHNALAAGLADVIAELGADPAGGFADLTTRLSTIPADPVAKAYVDVQDDALRTQDVALSNRIDTLETIPARVDELEGAVDALTTLRFPHPDYPTLADLFTHADTLTERVVITIAPGEYVTAPLRITKSDRTVNAYGATITLAASTVANALVSIAPTAYRVRFHGGAYDGNAAAQTGATSHGFLFEEYNLAQGFRFSDRSSLLEVSVDNCKSDGIRIERGRLHIKLNDCFSRNHGRYALFFGGTDCSWQGGGLGVAEVCAYFDGGANWLTESGLWHGRNAGIYLTSRSLHSFIVGNSIDHNATGIKAVGVSGSALDLTISGNHFRSNSNPELTGVTTGTLPDLYLEQVAFVNIIGNTTGRSDPSVNVSTSYAIEFGAGCSSISEAANRFRRSYHASGKVTNNRAPLLNRTARTDWLADAATDSVAGVRVGAESFDRFQLRPDALRWGSGAAEPDVNLYRDGADRLRTDDALTVGGAHTAARVLLTGTAGAGYVLFPEQTGVPGAVPDAVKMFTRDNGAGKTQVCVIFPGGAVGVLATEP